MPDQGAQRSITDLIGGLAADISGLFRTEIELAKTEVSEKVDSALGASTGVAIGGVLTIGAVGVLLAAIVTGIAWLLTALGLSDPAASFIASLLVAAVTGIIAWSFISASLNAWKASPLALDRTTNSLARDAKVVKDTF